MEFPSSLTQAVLLSRHKRFLAEVIVNNQEHRIIYCPNVGLMTGCDILGSRIWFSRSSNFRRKFPDTWELVEVDVGHLVCVNIAHSRTLLIEALSKNLIEPLRGYTHIAQDPPLMGDCSFDLLLSCEQEKCFVCINNVTLGDEIHRGFFPDAKTGSATDQLKSLIQVKQLGYRAILMYSVLHTGIDRVFPADHIDPEYGSVLRQALIAGVEILGYRADIDLKNIQFNNRVEICVPVRLIGRDHSEQTKK